MMMVAGILTDPRLCYGKVGSRNGKTPPFICDHTHTLQRHFRIFEVLYHEWQPPVADEVGVADEEEFCLEFHWLTEFEFIDGAGADEVALGSDAYRFVGFSGSVADFAGVEDVDFCDLGFLVDLFFFEFGILGLVEGGGFFPGGLFQVEPLH